VIAGRAKGRRLKGPREHTGAGSTTRPSSDLVRGAVFSALEAMGADFSRTLDLYAGSGALGIEALSRGAEWCDFVERDRAAANVIKENLATTGFEGSARVYPIAVERALERLDGGYTLVLADPPYADDGVWGVLESLQRDGLLGEGAVVVLEHSAREEPRGEIGDMSLLSARRHGDSAIAIYR
jgi:16S rRNA (guanine966-N2)-methyltransferase